MMPKWIIVFIWGALKIFAWILQFVGCTMIVLTVLLMLWHFAGRFPE